MRTRAEKKKITDILQAAGTWKEAAEFREMERQRLRDEGRTKEEAVEGSWDAMIAEFVPNAEDVKPAVETMLLPDGAESIDDVLDPEYKETDPARQMRDAYQWIQREFHRIVSDRDGGGVDLTKASTRPPVGIAVSIVQSWAAKPFQKRDGLFREIRAWLLKSSDDGETADAQACPGKSKYNRFLDNLC